MTYQNYVTDFNDIAAVQDELIPAGTIVSVRMVIRPGGFGPDQMLAKSRGTGILYVNAMLIVTDGLYALRRIYHRFGVQAYEPGILWVEKGLSKLRAILESARNILPTDTSDAAKEKRKISNYKDFDCLEFLIKVGIETPPNPQYNKANSIQCIVTPDFNEYAEYKAKADENIGAQAAWPLLKRV